MPLPLVLFALSLLPQSGSDPAQQLWQDGRRAGAVEAWAERLADRPGDEELRRLLAERQVEIHWYEAALQTLAPLGPEADALRGLALYRLARWEEALARLSPDDPAHALMRLEALEALGREDQAAAALERAHALLGPQAAGLLAYDGRALARRGQHAAAVEAFERALAIDSLDAPALYGLGRSLIALGERERGLELLERHRELTPLLDRLDFAQRGVDLAPLHAPNLAALGDAERALGRLDRAESLYLRALELAEGTDVTPIALRLSRLQAEDRDDVDRAVGTLETAAARVRDARLYVRAGDLLLAADRPIEAVQRFLEASELRPGDPAIAARVEAARAAYRRDPDK